MGECEHQNIAKLNEIWMDPTDLSLYLIYDYAEYDLWVCARTNTCVNKRES